MLWPIARNNANEVLKGQDILNQLKNKKEMKREFLENLQWLSNVFVKQYGSQGS